jgi:putative oxidoreductase
MSGWENLLFLLGRVLIGGFFLWKASEKIRHWNDAVSILKKKKVSHISYVLPISTAIQLIGGLSVILGFYTDIGATFLALHMIAHMYKIHGFWNMNGQERNFEKLSFMKDLAILGELFIFIVIGSGPFSIY